MSNHGTPSYDSRIQEKSYLDKDNTIPVCFVSTIEVFYIHVFYMYVTIFYNQLSSYIKILTIKHIVISITLIIVHVNIIELPTDIKVNSHQVFKVLNKTTKIHCKYIAVIFFLTPT